MWIDTHCHLDAPEFDDDRGAVIARAHQQGVRALVVPAVWPAGFAATRQAAFMAGGAYALGTHPMWLDAAGDDAAEALARALVVAQTDPRCVAVGEIGLDFFGATADRARQVALLEAQLKLAREYDWPVLLHVRQSVDAVLSALRRIRVLGGVAHAFNGSAQQAQQLINLGFKLGFGGAMTFERALHLRRLATHLPAEAIVLETDAPDIPPQWLYRTAAERQGGPQHRNEPAELPAIAQTLATLRGWSLAQTAAITTANARAALPRLAALFPDA
jgi:TatD DNase family protein